MSTLPEPGLSPVLSVRGLSVTFDTYKGPVQVLDDVSFDIAPGEILGVVGESGAGKSMTGAAVIGLIEPPGRISAGTVQLRGERIDTLRGEDLRRVRGRRIGSIFQDPLTSLNPVYTIGRHLVETVRTHLPVSEKEAQARALALLEEVEIPQARERMAQYPHQFSGGMRQRVAIAIALLHKPDLIIADEPTTALDVTIQAQILAQVQTLCRETGTALIWVSHDLAVVAALADRICVMYAGRVVETGTVDEVIDRPAHPYTIGLIGSVPGDRPRGEALFQIPGMAPSALALPQGCAFRPRCGHATDACLQAPETTWRGDRAFRCVHPQLGEPA